MMGFIPLLLTLTGCDAVGPFMAKFIPALEYVNEEWAPITMECDQPFSSRKPKRCVTQTIRCGDTIRGNNKMGRDQWGSDFYRKATCLAVSSAGGHGGSEMVYRISVPKHTRAIAKLKSDCVDLDVFALSLERSRSGMPEASSRNEWVNVKQTSALGVAKPQ